MLHNTCRNPVSSENCNCGDCDRAWFSAGWQCPRACAPTIPKGQQSVAIPQRLVGVLLGSRGEMLKKLQDMTNCIVHIDDRHDHQGREKSLRDATIRARQGVPSSREEAIELCVHTVRMLCEEEGLEVADAVRRAEELKRLAQEEEHAVHMKAHDDVVVSRVAAVVGDVCSDIAIRDALEAENWDEDAASDRLLRESYGAVDHFVAPVVNVQKVLQDSSRTNVTRSMTTPSASETEPSATSKGIEDPCCGKPPKSVTMVLDVFAKLRAEGRTIDNGRIPRTRSVRGVLT